MRTEEVDEGGGHSPSSRVGNCTSILSEGSASSRPSFIDQSIPPTCSRASSRSAVHCCSRASSLAPLT